MSNAGEEAHEMNDGLRNALKQLKRRAAGQRQAMPPTPKEAQAPLDERDVLRKVCEALQTNGIHVIVNRLRWDDVGYNDLSDYLATVAQQAHAALGDNREAPTDWKAVAQAEVESLGSVTAEEVRRLNEPVKEHMVTALDKIRNGEV